MEYTYRGKKIDLQSLIMMNEHTVALGNANMNARGDVLGKGGRVVKTAEERHAEYIQKSQAINTNEGYATSNEVQPTNYSTDAAEVAEDVLEEKKAPRRRT
jgi:hypothetical protein